MCNCGSSAFKFDNPISLPALSALMDDAKAGFQRVREVEYKSSMEFLFMPVTIANGSRVIAITADNFFFFKTIAGDVIGGYTQPAKNELSFFAVLYKDEELLRRGEWHLRCPTEPQFGTINQFVSAKLDILSDDAAFSKSDDKVLRTTFEGCVKKHAASCVALCGIWGGAACIKACAVGVAACCLVNTEC